MKIALIALLVLLALLLLPFGAWVRYDQEGFVAFVKVLFLRFQVYPAPEKKKDEEKKQEQRPSEVQPPHSAEEKKEAPKKGGKLELVRSALPLVKPALVGLKKRLSVNQLDLHVTWAGSDPADVAMGYGCANAALGTLWAVIDQNFKVKKSDLGVSVDFDAPSPTVYLNATVTLNLWKALTLVLPLLVRFLRNYSRLKREKGPTVPDNKTKKEA